MAFLDRTKRLHDGPDSAVNTEYLKACVYGYMVSDDPKDKIRLANVISTILKLTLREKAEVDRSLARDSSSSRGIDEGLSTIAGIASSFFGTPSK